MKLSIIVPIYKVEDYIVRCMEGILHQDLDDYEVIAVDDGSLDRSVEALQTYLDAHPTEAARVRIIRKENGGLSDARNAGLAVATGEYVWFVDSDDTIAENCLGALYETAIQDDLDLLMFDEQNVQMRDNERVELASTRRKGILEETVVTGIDLFIELRQRQVYYASACGYWIRRSVFDNNHLAFQKGMHHEDELFTPQVLHYAQRARYIATCPYIRYIHEGSITTGENIDQLVKGYAAVVSGLLKFADDRVELTEERHYLNGDILDMARIMIGESSRYKDLTPDTQELITDTKRLLKDHRLNLGLPFTLYTIKNQMF